MPTDSVTLISMDKVVELCLRFYVVLKHQYKTKANFSNVTKHLWGQILCPLEMLLQISGSLDSHHVSGMTHKKLRPFKNLCVCVGLCVVVP